MACSCHVPRKLPCPSGPGALLVHHYPFLVSPVCTCHLHPQDPSGIPLPCQAHLKAASGLTSHLGLLNLLTPPQWRKKLTSDRHNGSSLQERVDILQSSLVGRPGVTPTVHWTIHRLRQSDMLFIYVAVCQALLFMTSYNPTILRGSLYPFHFTVEERFIQGLAQGHRVYKW